MEYLPMISPVNVIFRLGDGMKYREIHPVLGHTSMAPWSGFQYSLWYGGLRHRIGKSD